ncbi:MAG: hypothetical protein QOJ29_5173 [Thermoleophilaceae bacterium]|nr:hypothetical protein [Thermoleophilaceae bacterium]
MPRWRDRRPLKRWRYVGAYGPELQICFGDAHIGPLRQRFWALATPDGTIREKTTLFGSAGVRIDGPEVALDAPGVRARLRLDEVEGVETLSRHGESYIWTRKQGGVRVSGLIEIDGSPLQFDARGMVDDSAGYHARHTVWSWSAGVGTSVDGRALAWNLVTGVHDATEASERTVWVDGKPEEVGPVEFAADLSSVGELAFKEWASRADNTNALLLKRKYRQPFGTFSGRLPNGVELREGYGVMESHDVHW